MEIASREEYVAALLAAPRPGSDKVLAFYDSRLDLVCADPACMLVPLDDHIVHRGDGLFESICYRERRLFALTAHLDRMAEGAALLDIQPPCPFEAIAARICEVARAGGEDHGDIRVFLSRGPGGFGISPSESPASSLYIVALKSGLPDHEYYARGLTAFASSIPPKQEYLARIKNTNYLPNVFMAREAHAKNMDVAITFDDKGHIGEAAIANVAIVDKDGVLRSPGLERILPGTTLIAALELAASQMPVRKGPIHKDEIATAQEMLLLTSATLCVSITHFDGRPIGSGVPGPVSLWLREALLSEMLKTGRKF
ncbi:MAG: aminodeoxychorismate lyase [Desulfovibrio sp.]|nr:aminodeoxychorismate lyase [Desulfovibrio sp.]